MVTKMQELKKKKKKKKQTAQAKHEPTLTTILRQRSEPPESRLCSSNRLRTYSGSFIPTQPMSPRNLNPQNGWGAKTLACSLSRRTLDTAGERAPSYARSTHKRASLNGGAAGSRDDDRRHKTSASKPGLHERKSRDASQHRPQEE